MHIDGSLGWKHIEISLWAAHDQVPQYSPKQAIVLFKGSEPSYWWGPFNCISNLPDP